MAYSNGLQVGPVVCECIERTDTLMRRIIENSADEIKWRHERNMAQPTLVNCLVTGKQFLLFFGPKAGEDAFEYKTRWG